MSDLVDAGGGMRIHVAQHLTEQLDRNVVRKGGIRPALLMILCISCSPRASRRCLVAVLAIQVEPLSAHKRPFPWVVTTTSIHAAGVGDLI